MARLLSKERIRAPLEEKAVYRKGYELRIGVKKEREAHLGVSVGQVSDSESRLRS